MSENEPELETAYKVVRVARYGELRSAMYHGGYDKAYISGEWTYPTDGTRLFVFGLLKDAQRFIEKPFDAEFEIWECDVTECDELEGRAIPDSISKYSVWWQAWMERPPDVRRVAMGRCWGMGIPLGTYIAGRVRLTNKVEGGVPDVPDPA